MTYDFFSIGDTQLDTIMVLAQSEAVIECRTPHEDCILQLSWADKIPVEQTHNVVAGNAANAAVTSSRLGLTTGFYSMLGDDSIADQKLTTLKSEGIDTTYAKKTPGTQSHQSTVISIDGERTILVYHAPRQYDLPNDLPASSWVYLTSMGKGSESMFPELRAYVKRTGAKLAYQPGTFQLRLGYKPAKQILDVTEFIVMNKEEAQDYTEQPDAEIPSLLDALHALGPKIVVVTDGTNGSYACDGETRWKMGIQPKVPRVEATGAGDAFSSGVVSALIDGQPLDQALRWGALNAEGVVQQFGPQAGILHRDELERLLVENPEFSPKELQ